MDTPRPDQMRREASDVGSLYLLVVVLVLIGGLIIQINARSDVMPPAPTVIQEPGPR